MHKDVGRRLKQKVQVCPDTGLCEEGSTSTPNVVNHDFSNPNLDSEVQDQSSSEPSFYAVSRKASVATWNSIRHSMLEAVTEYYMWKFCI